MRFVLLIGVVSLFADMSYEGARSITGPFLAFLGASAFVTGVVAAVLYLGGGYSGGFAVLLVPGILAMGVLIAARRLYPRPRELEEAEERPITPDGRARRFPRVFWLYLAFVGVAGYAHFQLISYHFGESSVVPTPQIPVFFAIAMGVDALVAGRDV